MRMLVSVALLVAVMVMSLGLFANTASAEDVKIVGVITKIEIAADQQSAVAVLKDNDSGELVTIIIKDELTIDKFKDHRIVVGDEIRTKFEKDGDKNTSKMFKKTAGC